MNDILYLLLNCEKLFNKSEIEYILSVLMEIYGIEFKGVVYNNDVKFWMQYYLKEDNLTINYDFIKRSNKINSLGNYRILFACVHELRHVAQYKKYYAVPKKLQELYDKCFEVINSNNIFNTILYSMYHDYFPVEVNADLVGYLFLLHVTRILGDDEYHQMFFNEFKARIMSVYSINYTQILKSLNDSTREYYQELDDYTKLMHGLLMYEDAKILLPKIKM